MRSVTFEDNKENIDEYDDMEEIRARLDQMKSKLFIYIYIYLYVYVYVCVSR